MSVDGVSRVRVGTAGWALRREHHPLFPPCGTHLQRYAQRLDLVEVNSSFYRHHRPATYRRWAASVPAGFRFSVKMHRSVSHDTRLAAPGLLRGCLEGPLELGAKLAVLLLQTPPSLAFEAATAREFLVTLRALFAGDIAMEPRHRSWFTSRADALLRRLRIARVAADPAPVPGAGGPGGFAGFAYWRWHGSPEIYRSRYDTAALRELASRVRGRAGPAYVVFDNTTFGAATDNALEFALQLA